MAKKKEDWEIARDERKQDIAKAIATMRPEQWKAVQLAVEALRDFDQDYFENYEIFCASVPRDLKRALEKLRHEFDLNG